MVTPGPSGTHKSEIGPQREYRRALFPPGQMFSYRKLQFNSIWIGRGIDAHTRNNSV